LFVRQRSGSTLFAQAEASLRGWPDDLLTVGLIVTATGLILVGLFGPTLLKAAVLAWVLFP
jgi:hypothetical protein